MQEVTFITGNLGKVEEAERFLGMPIAHTKLDLIEIQSIDPQEIVKDKAQRAYMLLEKPVLVEDVSLVFSALGRLPGPFIKYFEQELGNERLCRLVDGMDRSCEASVLYGYHDGTSVHFFSGSMKGTIADAPRGERSFGWASIVIPDGSDKTYAEMSDEEQANVAMRKPALTALAAQLATTE
jgi:non-canonical purine NTP pyrophosphatase (RdgB/HAM1 family)